MEIAMLILSIISTLVAIASFIVSITIRKDTNKIIKNQNTIINEKRTNVKNNNGVLADKISGGVNINGTKS